MSVTSSVGEEALAAVLGEFWTYVGHRDGQDGAAPEDDRHVLFIKSKVLHGEIDTRTANALIQEYRKEKGEQSCGCRKVQATCSAHGSEQARAY